MILLVDDERENIESLAALLQRSGYECVLSTSAKDGLEILRSNEKIQLLITDLKMPGGMNGIELLQNARIIRPDVQRILVTAFGTIEDTVKAMKSGAFDVIPKPIKFKVLKEKIEELLNRSIENPLPFAKTQISPSYAKVLERLRRAAQSDANVLFLGESGTGKSYLSKQLHNWSARKNEAFVALNCAAIPADLLESELFGYEKGAFTGATANREGKIQAADKGTLLLDEIGDLSTALQAKLLQFIQDRQYFKLGSNKAISSDVRILSASNQDITSRVSEKLFREDLLYRLRVVEITIPALRERKEDLFWLVPSLLDRYCEKNNIEPLRYTQEAFQSLWSWDWPGNIRELENVVESSIVMAAPEQIREGFLDKDVLPENISSHTSGPEGINFPDLASVERKAIREAMLLTGGNRRQTAGLLGISERTLYRVLGGEK
ncbi:sigma-54-dependent Fis family transcriptional regulator [bacterium]|nr:sigma-54-dependent Fis family transcriptional regulator [bacterium]